MRSDSSWPKPSSPGSTRGINELMLGVRGKSLPEAPCWSLRSAGRDACPQGRQACGDEGCAEHRSVPLSWGSCLHSKVQ